jgi:hypothetical protein
MLSPWMSSPLRQRATVLSLPGVEAEAKAEPLSEGEREPPPPRVGAEWGPTPENIVS